MRPLGGDSDDVDHEGGTSMKEGFIEDGERAEYTHMCSLSHPLIPCITLGFREKDDHHQMQAIGLGPIL